MLKCKSAINFLIPNIKMPPSGESLKCQHFLPIIHFCIYLFFLPFISSDKNFVGHGILIDKLITFLAIDTPLENTPFCP